MTTQRSLYQCLYAKVLDDKIYCAKNHSFGFYTNGMMSIQRLVRGEPLRFAACQHCSDYEEAGPPIPKEERGWLELVS